MKIQKTGNIEAAIQTCPRCQAELEYDTTDICGGTGQLKPFNRHDYSGNPQIKDYGHQIINYVLKTYNNDYVEIGQFCERDGYIVCPCCGQKIELKSVPVMSKIYPCAKALDSYVEEGPGDGVFYIDGKKVTFEEAIAAETFNFGRGIQILRRHIDAWSGK